MCGLRIEVEYNTILSVRPDKEDVFSRGYACPKGLFIHKLEEDPDRLRMPVTKNKTGMFEKTDWQQAFDLAEHTLEKIRAQYGDDSIAFYQGNPSGHQHGTVLTTTGLIKALNTRNSYNASSQDTNPRFAVSYYLYGASLAIPIPDIDRTSFFLCMGANPLVSNGSLMTAPDMRRRMKKVQARGGRVVVVDPCYSETAKKADEYIPIRPGGDAALLLSMLRVLQKNGLIHEDYLARISTGWHEISSLLPNFGPKAAARVCGVSEDVIERLAISFAESEAAVCYTRLGVCLNEYSTLATWTGDLLNIVTGNLGREGGAMFPKPPIDLIAMGTKQGNEGIGRWHSRVRGLPEVMGVLPSTALAEEIETRGKGQIRALVVLMGNPVLSVPNGRRLAKAFQSLDFMVSIDFYINETSKYADVILPPAGALTQDYFPIMYPLWSVRNMARWSPAVLNLLAEERGAWEIVLELSERLGGGATGNYLLDRIIKYGRRLGLRWHPTVMADMLLRLGPYGDRFMPFSSGLNMKKIKEAPHGIDLGALEPGFEKRIFHKDKKLHLAPDRIIDAYRTYAETINSDITNNGLVLIGRRELRSNNSWMHNIPELITGRDRCILWVNPEDAAARHMAEGDRVTLRSRVNSARVPIHITDDIRPGVVSLPHGYGHNGLSLWQKVAAARPGISINDWTDDGPFDEVTAQSILNGVPVELFAET